MCVILSGASAVLSWPADFAGQLDAESKDLLFLTLKKSSNACTCAPGALKAEASFPSFTIAYGTSERDHAYP